MRKILLPLLMIGFILACRDQQETNSHERIPDTKALPEKGIIEIDSFKLHYTIEGQGIPCLVIGSSVYYPRTFSEQLKQQLKMYFVDMRWFAPQRGEMPPDTFTIQKIAEDIEQIRQKLHLEKPVVIGHSIHGSVAMEYAKIYSENISSVVMICSPNIYGNDIFEQAANIAWASASPNRQQLQNDNWAELANVSDKYTPAELIVENYCAMAPKYWYDPMYDAHELWKDMTIHADLMQQLYGELFANYTMFPEGQAAPAPSLAIVGQYDFVIPPALWERDQKVKNLTIAMLNKSGHTPQLEESKVFDKILLKWIKSKKQTH
jgi:proline iminopeptidase